MKEERKKLFEELVKASRITRGKIVFLNICTDMLCQAEWYGIDKKRYKELVKASKYLQESGLQLERAMMEILNAYEKEKELMDTYGVLNDKSDE